MKSFKFLKSSFKTFRKLDRAKIFSITILALFLVFTGCLTDETTEYTHSENNEIIELTEEEKAEVCWIALNQVEKEFCGK